MANSNRVRSYFYFTGESIDGDIIAFDTPNAITQLHAEFIAKKALREVGGGHIDVYFSETDEFAFDVEI